MIVELALLRRARQPHIHAMNVGLVRCSVIALLLAVLVGCTYPPVHKVYDFTAVVRVKTPTGFSEGQSHIAVRRTDYEYPNWCSWMCPEPKPDIKVQGEAVVVPMPGHAPLIMTLSAPDTTNWVAHYSYNLPGIIVTRKTPCGYPELAEMLAERDFDHDGCLDFTPEIHTPYFVMFADPSRFNSIRWVDPGNLAASFGPGYQLKSVRLISGGKSSPQVWRHVPQLAVFAVKPENSTFGNQRIPFADAIGRQSFKQEDF